MVSARVYGDDVSEGATYAQEEDLLDKIKKKIKESETLLSEGVVGVNEGVVGANEGDSPYREKLLTEIGGDEIDFVENHDENDCDMMEIHSLGVEKKKEFVHVKDGVEIPVSDEELVA
ncbi:hypothetical protein GYH30_054797 [Glycine max]|nr:hypothetical protein GYH30_054797 [Glycine max]